MAEIKHVGQMKGSGNKRPLGEAQDKELQPPLGTLAFLQTTLAVFVLFVYLKRV